jgi:hypothetical protein
MADLKKNLPKLGKNDYTNPNSFRPISLILLFLQVPRTQAGRMFEKNPAKQTLQRQARPKVYVIDTNIGQSEQKGQ